MKLPRLHRWLSRLLLGEDTINLHGSLLMVLDELKHIRPMLVLDAMDRSNILLTPLGETADDQYLNLLQRLRSWQSLTTGLTSRESERRLCVEDAKDLVRSNPMAERAVQIWTDFGFGTRVSIIVADPAAAEVFDEFWSASRNRPMWSEKVLHEHSQQILTVGELFWPVTTSRLTGESTIRSVLTEEIIRPIFSPDDNMVVAYWERAYQRMPDAGRSVVWYRDWQADDATLALVKLDDGVVLAHDMESDRDVVMYHAAFNRQSVHEVRGWPLTTTSGDWMREYHRFLEDRRAVTRAVAAFVDQLIFKGGSASVNAMRTRLDRRLQNISDILTQNEPLAATHLANEAAGERKRLALGTAASDARIDSMLLAGQAATGVSVSPGLLGRTDMMQNRSVAEVAMLPSMRAWRRYRLLWDSIWDDMVNLVLDQKEMHSKDGSGPYEDRSVSVSSNALLEFTYEEVLAVMQAIGTAVGMGIDPKDLESTIVYLLRLTLRFVGADNVEKLVPDSLSFTSSTDATYMSQPDGGPVEGEAVRRTVAMNYALGSIGYRELVENVVGVDL